MKKVNTQVPTKMSPLTEVVEINAQKPLGLTASVYIHEVARKLPLYNQEIDCNAQGQDKEGNKIKVNTVGRWFFGVPGYAGHVRIVPSGNNVSIYFAKEAPKVVYDLVSQIKQTMEVVS
ncbi:hypothetical protein IT409_00700 [Candidatus Falkowbacteria bacterium]|nr:hypothetical protein [Candidatus Falkowbacteria bacterium]